MRLHQRGVFWVVLLIIGVVGTFAAFQLWLSYGATPSTGIMVSVNMNVAPGPAKTFNAYLGDRRTGNVMPILELPDSITKFEEEAYPTILLADDADRVPRFDLREWLTENFPDSTILELGTPVAVAADEEGAGMTGTVTEVRLRRGDGSLDPFWFITCSPKESAGLWGTIARARAGTFVETSQWNASSRAFLWWREVLLLRREICFGIELFADFEENIPGETYWLDAVNPLDETLPAGAVPQSTESPDATAAGGGPR